MTSLAQLSPPCPRTGTLFRFLVAVVALVGFVSYRYLDISLPVRELGGWWGAGESRGQEDHVQENQPDLSTYGYSTSIGSVDLVKTAVMTSSKLVWPSLLGTNITVEEIQSKIKHWVARSVSKNPACADVHKNMTSYWRSVSPGLKTLDADFRRMNLASDCGAFNDQRLMAFAPSDLLSPWERDYLSQPVFDDMKDTAWATLSEVDAVTEGPFFVGDTVQFRITVKDGRGQRRPLGGDSVRLWLETADLKAAIAADVTDNKDGSYLATAPLPWKGSVRVKATVAHTRELFRTSLYIQRIYKTTHWITGSFFSRDASEATPCSPFPVLPGFSEQEVCNVTKQNGGFPWFCGKPRKSAHLQCSHFSGVTKLTVPASYPLTEAEEEILYLTESWGKTFPHPEQSRTGRFLA
ncbi:uncharacterized protein LOC101861110 [Aplysia californica]|uniref:Uncharacterized protein LOC101861110 n=1 Tax=Aplysia californica TaxID=6500 RepID=A0ABM0ZWB9_APLCA|nr:uncharacterized protein LOC101861110 [Aplysia californica]